MSVLSVDIDENEIDLSEDEEDNEQEQNGEKHDSGINNYCANYYWFLVLQVCFTINHHHTMDRQDIMLSSLSKMTQSLICS
jgi:hypothetical protein